MKLCIDIGGTKTALAVFDNSGKIQYQTKIKTDHNYETFLNNLKQLITKNVKYEIDSCCIAAPGLIDRANGTILSLGNLDWRDKHIKDDLKDIVKSTIVVENDTKLGGLGEARALGNPGRILYITVSTGIGSCLVINQRLSDDVADSEIGKMPLEYDGGRLEPWENFSSGRYFYNKFGLKGSEITEEKMWHEIGMRVAYGTAVACTVFQPQVIVYGGGMGQYADSFIHVVQDYLATNLHINVRQPEEIIRAKHADNSVIYGCFEFIKDN